MFAGRRIPTLAVVAFLAVSPLHALADDDAGTSSSEVIDASSTTTTTSSTPATPTATTTTTTTTVTAPAPVPAPAQVAPEGTPADPSLETLTGDLYRGIASKDWFLAIGAALSILILGAKWLLTKKWPTFEKDRWGIALAGAMAGLTALAAAWLADTPVDGATTIVGALKIFAAAVATYVTGKKILAPSDTPAPLPSARVV